jgi:hypothetical protein
MYKQRSAPREEQAPDSARPSKSKMRKFAAQAADLNRRQLGDQAAFYLTVVE